MLTVNQLELDNPTYSKIDKNKYDNAVQHPLVRTHLETKRKAQYFHVTKARGIIGMPNEEVRPFLDNLLNQTIRPENSIRY